MQEELSRQKGSMSEVDLAYQILKDKGEPMHFRELIDQVLQQKPMANQDGVRAMANIYTNMNLDSRFIHTGQGQWGLKNWLPTRSHKRLPAITLMNKSVEYDDRSPALGVGNDEDGLLEGDGMESLDSMDYMELGDEEDWE